MSGPKFKVVDEDEISLLAPPDPAATRPVEPRQSAFTAANATILLLSLRALSQRTAMELARLASNAFTAGLVLAVWALVARVLPDPTGNQLIALAGFGVFCLLIETVRRRK